MTQFRLVILFDNGRVFGTLLYSAAALQIHLLPARHAGNGLWRGYFLALTYAH